MRAKCFLLAVMSVRLCSLAVAAMRRSKSSILCPVCSNVTFMALNVSTMFGVTESTIIGISRITSFRTSRALVGFGDFSMPYNSSAYVITLMAN